jgi:hypothetical protein
MAVLSNLNHSLQQAHEIADAILGGHPKAAIEGHLKTGHRERPRH